MATQSIHRHTVSHVELESELGGRLVDTGSAIFEVAKYVVPIAILLTLAHSLLATITFVDGPSMQPTYYTEDMILVDRRDWLTFARGDVVVLRYPGDPEHRVYIKRVVAEPGDTVAVVGGQVVVNGSIPSEPYLNPGTLTQPDVAQKTLADDEYYTLGDNRPVSNDSRFFGPVERRFIVGRVIATLLPSDRPS
ncbi:signal peptidase I [Candidatus Berkelbacteria bacterium]|nr:signal peptidase I [Candidatus Berkelbacteria bacterium]